MRLLRTLAPLALVAALVTACGGGSSSTPSGSSSGQSGDSTILGPSSGFEIRTVYARYAPGVPFGPQLPQALVQELASQHCPMQARIVEGMLMECDAGKTVYLLNNPIVRGDVTSATPVQFGKKNIWYVEVKLDSSVVGELTNELKPLVGNMLAFTYDGVVLQSLVVDPSFHVAHFAITGNYDKTTATKLAHQLTS